MDSPDRPAKGPSNSDNDATSIRSEKKEEGFTAEMVKEVGLVRNADRTKRTLKVRLTDAALPGMTIDISRYAEPAHPAYRNWWYVLVGW